MRIVIAFWLGLAAIALPWYFAIYFGFKWRDTPPSTGPTMSVGSVAPERVQKP